MGIMTIILSAVSVGAVGLLIGLLLCLAGKKFAVEENETEAAVRAALPGNNCGGCGYAGCDGLAQAIAQGSAPVNACPVGGTAAAAQIAQIMGVEAQEDEPKTAFVACGGDCTVAKVKYEYYGKADCGAASVAPGGGDKLCGYGCLGLGSCVAACPFDAIHVIKGVAVVDEDKCKACGKCVAACPKHLIFMIPKNAPARVRCSSHDMAKMVMAACETGCRGCTLCTRVCPNGAVKMDNSLAVIDYSLCTGCGTCAEKCPARSIQRRTT
ncbi:MAG: RnfABCDGE type electron transport complex subunit B [Lachnospiraceae bacterium]|nr:RnfABCDGE type electron transport complex subunit B [Lachnospiraceae bacterium]